MVGEQPAGAVPVVVVPAGDRVPCRDPGVATRVLPQLAFRRVNARYRPGADGVPSVSAMLAALGASLVVTPPAERLP